MRTVNGRLLRTPGTVLTVGAIVALLLLLAGVLPALADDFGPREPGRQVYDRTGLLTPDELTAIEQAADTVVAAGAPTIVYLQAKEADYDETLEDARELMEDWNVQSQPSARDGIVILLNLEPDDLRHGQLALVAGEAHFDGGNLPQYELDRTTSEMRAILGDEETAEGIITGLEMIAESLTNGPAPPPEPTRAEQIARDLTSGPISIVNILSLPVAAVLALFTRRLWRSRPVSAAPATPTTAPPSDLMPAAAGALVTGSVNDLQMEATILDLARRGAIVMEPENEKNKVQVRLLDPSVPRNPVEQHVWEALQAEADPDGLITSKKLSKVRSHWRPAKDALQSGLEARGWFNPHVGKQRTPLVLASLGVLVLAFVVFITAMIGEQLWGLVGTGLLAAVGFTGLVVAASYPNTTTLGEAEAQPWRGYLSGLKRSQYDREDLDLDDAVPYALAMNATASLDKRLKQASTSGYAPLWLGPTHQTNTWGTLGFYPYWTTFHASASPTVGTGAGGASAGSGGSGGSF